MSLGIKRRAPSSYSGSFIDDSSSSSSSSCNEDEEEDTADKRSELRIPKSAHQSSTSTPSSRASRATRSQLHSQSLDRSTQKVTSSLNLSSSQTRRMSTRLNPGKMQRINFRKGYEFRLASDESLELMGWNKVEQCWAHEFHDCWTHPSLTENDTANESSLAHFERPTHIPSACGGGLQIHPCRDCKATKNTKKAGRCEITSKGTDRWYKGSAHKDLPVSKEMVRVAREDRPHHHLEKIPWDTNGLAEDRDHRERVECFDTKEDSSRASFNDEDLPSSSLIPSPAADGKRCSSEDIPMEVDEEGNQLGKKISLSASSQRCRKRRMIMSRPPSPEAAQTTLAEQLFEPEADGRRSLHISSSFEETPVSSATPCDQNQNQSESPPESETLDDHYSARQSDSQAAAVQACDHDQELFALRKEVARLRKLEQVWKENHCWKDCASIAFSPLDNDEQSQPLSASERSVRPSFKPMGDLQEVYKPPSPPLTAIADRIFELPSLISEKQDDSSLDELGRLRIELRIVKSQLVMGKKTIDAQYKALTKRNEQLKEMQERLDERDSTIEVLEQKLITYKRVIQEKEEQVAVLITEKEDTIKQLDELHVSLQESSATIDELKEKKEVAMKRTEELERQLKEKDEVLDKLGENQRRAVSKLGELVLEKEALEDEIKKQRVKKES
ncbi:hypothetical protein IAT40_005939 [Kwoniella sp. CBS 6097]